MAKVNKKELRRKTQFILTPIWNMQKKDTTKVPLFNSLRLANRSRIKKREKHVEIQNALGITGVRAATVHIDSVVDFLAEVLD